MRRLCKELSRAVCEFRKILEWYTWLMGCFLQVTWICSRLSKAINASGSAKNGLLEEIVEVCINQPCQIYWDVSIHLP